MVEEEYNFESMLIKYLLWWMIGIWKCIYLPPRLSSCRMETVCSYTLCKYLLAELEYAPFQNVRDSVYISVLWGIMLYFPLIGKKKCWGIRIRGRYFWFERWDSHHRTLLLLIKIECQFLKEWTGKWQEKKIKLYTCKLCLNEYWRSREGLRDFWRSWYTAVTTFVPRESQRGHC